MNRVNVKMNMDIISAFAEGKIIQYKDVCGGWNDLTEEEGLPMNTLNDEPNNFRIKPEPKYRPFANAEECWEEMLKHQPFGWVKNSDVYYLILFVGNATVSVDSNANRAYDLAIECFTFVDGTPFGVKVEEE